MHSGLKTKKGTSFCLLSRPANTSEEHFTRAAEFVPERCDVSVILRKFYSSPWLRRNRLVETPFNAGHKDMHGVESSDSL